MKSLRAASLRIQNRWIPKGFVLNPEFGCLTNAECLVEKNPKLRFVIGRTRLNNKDKWGDHAWCVTPHGKIIDPYFRWRFSDQWFNIQYREDKSAFGGDYEIGLV